MNKSFPSVIDEKLVNWLIFSNKTLMHKWVMNFNVVKRSFIFVVLSFIGSVCATENLPLSEEFVEYHLRAATTEVEDDYVFYLLQENIDDLDRANTCDSAARELINLIEEGCLIDALNLARLISLLDHANPQNNATKVILKAIEHRTPINADHLNSLITLLDHANPSDCAAKILMKAIEYNAPIHSNHLGLLIKLLTHANPSNNATFVLLKAIECRVKFGPKERVLLADASRTANALNNVERIRKALHERVLQNP